MTGCHVKGSGRCIFLEIFASLAVRDDTRHGKTVSKF